MFLEAHRDRKMEVMLWDTFKAYLRGVTRSTISYINRTNRQEKEELVE